MDFHDFFFDRPVDAVKKFEEVAKQINIDRNTCAEVKQKLYEYYSNERSLFNPL
jgi:hypothetical protein